MRTKKVERGIAHEQFGQVHRLVVVVVGVAGQSAGDEKRNEGSGEGGAWAAVQTRSTRIMNVVG